MNGRVGKKIKFYIGYLRNENVFVLYNADSYMGLFIKIVETGFPHTQAGWRQIRDEDPELVAYANEVFDSYMEDWIEYCAIPTDEDTETDKEDLIRDYIIEDDNNTCETGCE